MSMYDLSAFVAIYAIAVATPGPGIAAIVARTLAGHTRGVPAFIGGFVAGDVVWLILAALGLAALAHTAQLAFMIAKYLGAAYLLYLAFRLWTAPARRIDPAGIPRSKYRLQHFFAGLFLALGNPKVMVFFLAILPPFVHLESLTPSGLLELIAVIVIVQPLILSIWAVAAARAQNIFRNPPAIRLLNRSSGTILAGAAIAVACR
jgi:threonine/homoserine/homoserine lactone efflux protein